jgi:hypothetical protein
VNTSPRKFAIANACSLIVTPVDTSLPVLGHVVAMIRMAACPNLETEIFRKLELLLFVSGTSQGVVWTPNAWVKSKGQG